MDKDNATALKTDLDGPTPSVQPGKESRGRPPASRVGTRQVKMNPTAFALMVKAIDEKAMDVAALREVTGLSKWTLRNYMKKLVLYQAAHIEAWGKDGQGRDVSPMYRLGFGINMPRRLKKTNTTRSQGTKAQRVRDTKRARQINAGD